MARLWLLALSGLFLASPARKVRPLLFLDDDVLTDEQHAYIHAWSDRIRDKVLLFKPSFSRHGGDHRSREMPLGQKLVLPPEQRRVRVTDNMRRHFQAAASLPFPPDSRLRPSSLPDYLVKATVELVRHDKEIKEHRAEAKEILLAAASDLRPFSAVINLRMPQHVYMIARGVNTAFIAAVIHAIDWLDIDLVKRFVEGFPIVGDIPDSGVYRPIAHADAATASTALSAFQETAPHWNALAHRRTVAKSSASFDDVRREAAVTMKTRAELSKGVLVGPYKTLDALRQAIASVTPLSKLSELVVRLLLRFGVEQKGATRAIDDGRSNGANSATTMKETVTTPSFAFVATVAWAVRDVAHARGLPPPALMSALSDLAMAYRTIPVSQPWFTAFVHLDTTVVPAAPRYYFLPGHNFGLSSAVVNFNRYAEYITVASCVLGIVINDHYYDDFIIVDLAVNGRTAIDFLETMVLASGTGQQRTGRAPVTAPELDPGKTKEPAYSNTVLGVIADLEDAHTEGVVHFSVSMARATSILDFWHERFLAGVLRPTDAAHLRGRLGFSFSAVVSGLGRAATLPLLERQYHDTSYEFVAGSDLYHSYVFFQALLPHLARLRLTIPLVLDPVPPLLVYTDASFFWTRAQPTDVDVCRNERGERPNGALGAVVYDPVDGTYRVADAKPPWAILAPTLVPKKNYIAFLEALAALSVYSTYPALFRGRKVNHFIDNTVALSALVHGYAGKPDMAKVVNTFYIQAAGLRTSVYFDYVPSKANIADLPSRGASHEVHLHLHDYTRRLPTDTLVVPNIASWHAPLASWLDI